MRTKTLLLAAAFVAAGISASVAQTVYSVNAVGYVNKSLVTGYNLLGNPLNGTNNNINSIMPVALGDSQIFRWNNAIQNFFPSDIYFDVEGTVDDGWYDADVNKSTTVINPGEGFFFSTPSPTTLTFVGEVPQGNLTNSIPPNYSFKSSIVPQSVGILSVGFPGVGDMQYIPWNPAVQGYAPSFIYFDVEGTVDDGFYDADLNKVDPTPAVAEGFLFFNPGATVQWGRTFSVN